MNLHRSVQTALLCSLTLLGPARTLASHDHLVGLDLATLMEMEIVVTSVSKREELLEDTPAAVTVITHEELRRSGATSVPEALRLVPGMGVSQAGASVWQVGARGFQSMFSDKLLVLVDGRSVYTPTFSGVYWDAVDLILEDIDRIEVIRGPGASVWGANAVNGVINVVTKSAQDTHGLSVSSGAGSLVDLSTTARLGLKINDRTALRFYGKYAGHDELTNVRGIGVNDGWTQRRGGLRLDWKSPENTTSMVQAEAHANEMPAFDGVARGAHLLGRFSRSATELSSYNVQAYVDRVDRSNVIGSEKRDTFDLDFQHNLKWSGRHELAWGLNYRFSRDDLSDVRYLRFDPERQDNHLLGAFVQNTFELPGNLDLTLGLKLEHNDYTGLETQPTARVAWKPTSTQTVWGAVSRAVRTPNRYDTGLMFDFPPFPSMRYGNSDFRSETLLAYELGYRTRLAKQLQVDVAGYYNVYSDIKAVSWFPPATLNAAEGDMYGGELSLTYQPFPTWRLTGLYSHHRADLHVPRRLFIPVTADPPRHQFGLHSSLDLGRDWKVDLSGRYVSRWQGQNVPSYVSADLRVAWTPSNFWEVAALGQNLLDRRHSQVYSFQNYGVQIPRSVFVQVTWRK